MEISAVLKKWSPILFLAAFVCVAGGQNKPPVCNQTYVSTSIVEGVPVGTTVLNFKDFCSDPEKGPLKYQLNDNANQQFTVQASTNLLKTNKPADAEAVLNYAPSFYASPWTLRVTIRDNSNAACIFTVLVKIISTNDNWATIKKLVVPAVAEDTQVGAIIGGCTLVDGDYPDSGHDIPYVEIIAGNEDNKFAVDYKTCNISLVGSLDYEAKPSYTLTFRAYNFPNDPNATTKQQTITVVDVNDNIPTCKSYNIIMDITEDKVTNDVLLKLYCWDVDSLNNGVIEFLSDTKGNNNYPLKVDQKSGEIRLTEDLDYDNDRANRNMDMAVVVSDKGNPAWSTTVTVALRMLDVDDQPPTFTQAMCLALIPENADLGQLVLTVSATDNDSPHTALSKITFGLETSCSQDWFIIDKYTGSILVNNFLDWETEPVVSCLVYAYSSNKYENRTFANVNITIIDVNDRPPQFAKYLFEGTVVENSPAFTYILTVTGSDPEDDVNGQFTYSFPDASPFAIDENTGSVYVKDSGIVDYETAVDYILLVAASDKGTPSLTSYARVSIKVEPVNEFRPVFTNLSDIHVSELTWPGTLVTTMCVEDGDAGNDGTVEYSLQDSSSLPFMLVQDTGSLFTSTGLDYEVTQSYTLVVTVVDKSQTVVKSSTGTLNVIIINENENDPVCQIVEPIIVTPNSHTAGDSICQLNCTDLDLNTLLRFDILRGDPNSLFDVDASSGIVQFQASPVEGSYIIVIGVSDQDKPVRMTEVFVQINVETILKFTNLPARTSVSEDAKVTQLLLVVSARGAYKSLTYEIVNGNLEGKFNLHQTKGELRLIGALDRETTNTYVITIRATTTNGQAAQDTLIIDVDDTNDNFPTYNSCYDYIRVSEFQSVPSVLQQYTATDRDILQNAEIVYSILSENPGMFKYTSTGGLQLISTLNYDIEPFYTLVLCATDRGVPPLSSTMLVNVEVLDENDNNIKIVPFGGTVPLSLPEDTAIGAAVIKIQIQNNETRSELTFTITSGNSGNNFTIDERTGVVYLIFALDRENASVLTIGVRVNSSSGKTDNTMLVINITDVNDNSPVFNPDNYVFLVPHGTSAGSSIGTLSVTDADAGANQDVVLSITAGDLNNVFTLSGKTLVATSLLDADVDSHYELHILASDYGTPSRNTTIHVTVLIQAELKVPGFFPTVDEIIIEETCLPGSLVYDANATDRGATERSPNHSGDVVYSLSHGDGATFYADRDNGKLQLVGTVSFSSKTSHTLVITAVNNIDTSLSDNITLTITVAQVNMYDPVFSQDVFIVNVSENVAVGTVIGLVTATDRDTGHYGKLSYSVESNEHFYVSPSTGVITLTSPLEYSIGKSYHLLVTATDNAGSNSRTDTSVVCINVIDTNNYPPVFINTPYVVTVAESRPVGSVLQVLLAEDLDSGVYGKISYSIVSGDVNQQFSLDSSTGVLILNSNLDFENSRRHILTIQGQDGGLPSLSSSVSVTIYVTDDNDNAPYFNEVSADLIIKRDTPAMTSVYQVCASDADADTNAIVRYTIQDNHLFSIDTVKGVITTATTLASAASFHTLIVAVTDQGQPQLSATMTINIALTPIRKVPTGDYMLEVRENEDVGTLVGSIANDPALNSISGYSIVAGNYDSAYTIVMNGNKEGVFRTNKVLDRETYPYYKLHVAVEHASGIKYIYVVVSVLDVNDNPPMFDTSTLDIYMVENLAPGNVVGALVIADADEEGVNSEWNLSISPPDSTGSTHFIVEPSGVIKVAKSVSYEAFSLVRFYVVATGRDRPQQSATATVMVNVVDVVETMTYKGFDTASYISRELPDDTTEEDLCTLKASHVGLSPGPGDVVKFITVGTGSVFGVQDRTNNLAVRRPSFISKLTRYFQWMIVKVTSAGVTTARALMIRLDTFTKNQHMMTATVDTDLADLRSKIETLRSELQTYFQPPQAVRIWKTQSISQPGRRRLLSAGSEALFVVVADEAADDMSNVHMAKTFLSNTEAVKPLQASPDGTPVQRLRTSTPPVISVLPYNNSNSADNSDDFDPAFIAVIVVGSITTVVLMIGGITMLVYCVCCRRSKKSDDKEGLVTSGDSETRKASFQTIAHSDLNNSQTSNKSPTLNTIRKTSMMNNDEDPTRSSVTGARTRSRSKTSGDTGFRQRKIARVIEFGVDPTDLDKNQVSNESSVVNILHKTSQKNQENPTSSTISGTNTVIRSHSMTGEDPSSRQRKITPVNEPGMGPTGFLEVPSSSPSCNSLLDESRSDGTTSKATSIIVSSLGQSLRASSSLPSRKSSTMLESLEVDAFNAPESSSVA